MARPPRRNKAREQRARCGEHETHGNRPAIQLERQTHTDIADDGQSAKQQHAAVAHREPERTSAGGEQNAFRDHLPRDAEAAASDRQSQRHLFLACGCAAHEQAGDVGARHEEDGERERQEHDGCRCRRTALVDARVESGLHQHSVIPIGVRIGLLETARDGRDFLPRLLERHARLHPPADLEVAEAALFRQAWRAERLRASTTWRWE